jgi:hypothetical protein
VLAWQRGEKLERWNAHLYQRGGIDESTCVAGRNIEALVVHARTANLGPADPEIVWSGHAQRVKSRPEPVFSLITDLKRTIRLEALADIRVQLVSESLRIDRVAASVRAAA